MNKPFDVDFALGTYISNNAIKPENFHPETIQKFGFHSDGVCRVGGEPNPDLDFVKGAAAKRREIDSQIEKPVWFHVLALHVIREHKVGEFGAEFLHLMTYHIAALLAQGETFDEVGEQK